MYVVSTCSSVGGSLTASSADTTREKKRRGEGVNAILNVSLDTNELRSHMVHTASVNGWATAYVLGVRLMWSLM